MNFHHSLSKNNSKENSVMKKLISIFISAALLVPFFAMLSYAVPAQPIYLEPVEAMKFYGNGEAVFSESAQQINLYSNPNGTYLFGNSLDSNQRTIYDAIVEQKAGLEADGKVTVSIPKPEDFSATLQGAVSAAMDDYPEYFWLGGYSVSYYPGTIYDITISFSLDTSSYATWDVLSESYYEMLNAVESTEIKGSTRYAKVKSIHDTVCRLTTYTGGVPMAHQPTGVFLNGQAVCEGYAEAFKLLCDRENIPCIIVVGTGNGSAHEWNYVQMDDGKWYGMDVTWDDQDDSTYYDYFLTGSESINAVFGKKKFGDGTKDNGDHVNEGMHFSDGKYVLTYPAISTQSYTGVIQMWNSEATFDNTRNFMFIPKGAVANQQILCTYYAWAGNAPSTNAATVIGSTTGGKLNITSPISRTYTIVRFGDVNKDGNVNTTDYSNVRDIVNCAAAPYTDEVQFAAADVNGDGVIDAFDALQIDCEMNGITN